MPEPDHLFRRRDVMLGMTAAALAPAFRARAAAPGPAPLELVATFTSPRQVTGVGVSRQGRVFVNFPRWEEDVAVSVAEVGSGGALTPFPNAGWNAFRAADPMAAKPSDSFVCVQSVTVDRQDRLWVLDPAAPGLSLEVSGGPKLVCIDLATNSVERVYRFGLDVAPQGSYLNDIRLTADGRRAVMTNSGQPGCLIALDVESGQARRVLDGHPSTQFQKGVTVTVDGRMLRQLDGEGPQFSADGIMIDGTDTTVYWQATTGRTMYRVPLASLFDRSLSPAELGAQVHVAAQTFVADGYWFSRRSGMLLTVAERGEVRRLERDGSFTVVAKDQRLLWPDSMAEGPDGAIYVTASHIPQMKTWQASGVARTQLFRFHPSTPT